jgi:hypothetical protein
MSTVAEAGLSHQKLTEIDALVRQAGTEAVRLRIVERFLSEVERRMMKVSPVVFDVERVRTAFQILKSIVPEDGEDVCQEAEFRLEQEFQLWRSLTIDRDSKIETYHFRRFCDAAREPLDDEIFIALALFYRGLPFSPSSQSKFDLAVSRLFTGPRDGDRRILRFTREEIIHRLRGLFDSSAAVGQNEEVPAAIDQIERFISEATAFADIEELIESKIFDRYRAFKRDLGPLFFEPDVIAVAVNCNVAVGNAFQDLLDAADGNLSETLTNDVDLAGVLHDPAPGAREHVNDVLAEFFDIKPDFGSIREDSDLGFLRQLLARAGSPPPGLENSETQTPSATSARDRLAPFLKTLTDPNPDADLLSEQIASLNSLENFDPSDFLYLKDRSPDLLSRRILGLVLWSASFRENELKIRRELPESVQREAMALLQKAEELADQLRSAVSQEDDAAEAKRYMNVLNRLLDSRLSLERAIVRFTNRNLVAAPVMKADVDIKKDQSANGGKKWFKWFS